MRFLAGERLPPSMAGLPRTAGHGCAHACEPGLGGQPDEQIMDLADRENRILISADTDFGELLANAPVLAPGPAHSSRGTANPARAGERADR